MTSNCYVYAHLDAFGWPVYIGFGRGHRCLDTHKRSPKHATFMENRFSEVGLDYINIVHKNLTEDVARDLERLLIHEIEPIYNRQMNGAANAGRGVDNHNSKLTDDDVEYLRTLWDNYVGSMRSFHRNYMPDFTWSSAYKLLKGVSYA